jgi:hypothetical protein
MELSGWIFLIGAWGIIIYLTVFCFIRVFVSERKENVSKKEQSNEIHKAKKV